MEQKWIVFVLDTEQEKLFTCYMGNTITNSFTCKNCDIRVLCFIVRCCIVQPSTVIDNDI